MWNICGRKLEGAAGVAFVWVVLVQFYLFIFMQFLEAQ